MAENLIIGTGNKEEKYRELLPQLHALVSTETDLIANLANVAAALKQTFGFFWVGFYLVKEGELVLGPGNCSTSGTISVRASFQAVPQTPLPRRMRVQAMGP